MVINRVPLRVAVLVGNLVDGILGKKAPHRGVVKALADQNKIAKHSAPDKGAVVRPGVVGLRHPVCGVRVGLHHLARFVRHELHVVPEIQVAVEMIAGHEINPHLSEIEGGGAPVGVGLHRAAKEIAGLRSRNRLGDRAPEAVPRKGVIAQAGNAPHGVP